MFVDSFIDTFTMINTITLINYVVWQYKYIGKLTTDKISPTK